MRIVIETIPHNCQRYNTVGDWQFDADGNLTVRVSEMNDSRYEFLVGIHEAIEAVCARHAGIAEAEVDAFDIEYENNRAEGDMSEPGDDPRCPVYRQHQIATAVEKLLAVELDVGWKEYDVVVNAL